MLMLLSLLLLLLVGWGLADYQLGHFDPKPPPAKVQHATKKSTPARQPDMQQAPEPGASQDGQESDSDRAWAALHAHDD